MQIIPTSKRATIIHQFYYNYSHNNHIVLHVEGNVIRRIHPLKIVLLSNYNTIPFNDTHSKGV